jgi:predicted dehydrogenase
MKKYRIGIIGYGGFGRFLHHWWSQLSNAEVVAIADKNLQGNIAHCKTYTDWHDLVNDSEIDIVSIVTPPALHAEMACAAMKANKHVILEKPVAISEEGAQQILQAQKETGMVITVDHMIRYNPIFQSFLKLGQSGCFGKLRHAVVNNYAQDAALPANHWFWNEELSGGIFIEHGVHFFDIINGLSAQQYVEVFGCSHRRNKAQRDQVGAMVLYNEGLIASYYHSFSGPGFFEQTTIELAYDLAKVEIKGWMPMNGTIRALVDDKTKDQLKTIPGWNLIKVESISELRDVSRPEGWGESSVTVDQANDHTVVCGGIGYKVNEMVTGTFEIKQTKGEVYGKCVQLILLDVIEKIEDRNHVLTVSFEDGYEAVKIAVRASGENRVS